MIERIVANPDHENVFPIGLALEPEYAAIARAQGAILLPYDYEFAMCNPIGAFNRVEYGTYSANGSRRGTPLIQFQVKVGAMLYADCLSRIHWVACIVPRNVATSRLNVNMNAMLQGGLNVVHPQNATPSIKFDQFQSTAPVCIGGEFDINPVIPAFYGFGLHAHSVYDV